MKYMYVVVSLSLLLLGGGCASYPEAKNDFTSSADREYKEFTKKVEKEIGFDPYGNSIYHKPGVIGKYYNAFSAKVKNHLRKKRGYPLFGNRGVPTNVGKSFDNHMRSLMEMNYNSSEYNGYYRHLVKHGWVVMRAGFAKEIDNFGSYQVPVILMSRLSFNPYGNAFKPIYKYVQAHKFKVVQKKPGKSKSGTETSSIAKKIRELKKLYDDGIISKKEYNKKKLILLDKM